MRGSVRTETTSSPPRAGPTRSPRPVAPPEADGRRTRAGRDSSGDGPRPQAATRRWRGSSGQNLAHRPKNWPLKIPCNSTVRSQFCVQLVRLLTAPTSAGQTAGRRISRPSFPILPSSILANHGTTTTCTVTLRAPLTARLLARALPCVRHTRRINGFGRADFRHSRSLEPRIGRSVSLDHAAELLGVSRRTIYNRIRDGRLQTMRTLGGSQRVLIDSVEEESRAARSGPVVLRRPAES